MAMMAHVTDRSILAAQFDVVSVGRESHMHDQTSFLSLAYSLVAVISIGCSVRRRYDRTDCALVCVMVVCLCILLAFTMSDQSRPRAQAIDRSSSSALHLLLPCLLLTCTHVSCAAKELAHLVCASTLPNVINLTNLINLSDLFAQKSQNCPKWLSATLPYKSQVHARSLRFRTDARLLTHSIVS